MKRRQFLQLAAAAGGAQTLATQTQTAAKTSIPIRLASFEFEEATIATLQAAMETGKETALSLTTAYLERIDALNLRGPTLRAVLDVNPDALAIAAALDRERQEKGPRGPLHGIPLMVKDNIDTHDKMTTTAGSLALLGSVPPRDAFVVQQLRKAGAVLLGKTNLSEWANFRGDRSSSGWSARGGQTNNPYLLDRNPSGSSSGSAVAASASLCAVTVGTETNGSVISPATVCGIVGIKPTVGLVSRSGIIPISHTQDTAGPMARTVRDAAILLGAMTGIDTRDSASQASAGRSHTDYSRFLNAQGLQGARLGVARRFFRSTGVSAEVLETALEEMKRLGAILIDPIDDEQALGRFGSAAREVMHYEFKANLNAYLAALGPEAPVKTLKDVIEFNESHRDQELRFFGQQRFEEAQEKGPLTDQAYLEALEKCRRLSRSEGIDAVMDQHQLDAVITPSGGPAGVTDLVYGDRSVGGSSSPAAVAGYPNITVPAGQVAGLPVGISFFGRAYSEPKLLKIAYAFEQATQFRKPPRFIETLS